MKNFKKTISLILAICMIASLAISASAANTVDVAGGTGIAAKANGGYQIHQFAELAIRQLAASKREGKSSLTN